MPTQFKAMDSIWPLLCLGEPRHHHVDLRDELKRRDSLVRTVISLGASVPAQDVKYNFLVLDFYLTKIMQ